MTCNEIIITYEPTNIEDFTSDDNGLFTVDFPYVFSEVVEVTVESFIIHRFNYLAPLSYVLNTETVEVSNELLNAEALLTFMRSTGAITSFTAVSNFVDVFPVAGMNITPNENIQKFYGFPGQLVGGTRYHFFFRKRSYSPMTIQFPSVNKHNPDNNYISLFTLMDADTNHQRGSRWPKTLVRHSCCYGITFRTRTKNGRLRFRVWDTDEQRPLKSTEVTCGFSFVIRVRAVYR